MLRRAAVADRPAEQNGRVHLVDVIEMTRNSPAPPAPAAIPVERLPRARYRVYAPIPGAPGACSLVVPEGSAMPPGAELMRSLTAELLEAHQRHTQWELRDQRIAGWRQRLAELDLFEQDIAAQRARALEQIAELGAMEPVEPLDWEGVARQIWRVTEFRPLPEPTHPSGMYENAIESEDARHHIFGKGRDRLGRPVK